MSVVATLLDGAVLVIHVVGRRSCMGVWATGAAIVSL